MTNKMFASSTKWCIRKFRSHYTIHYERKSDSQVQRETKLFKIFPFNRWILVVAAVLVQLCIGSLYAWSVFNVPIEEEFGLVSGTAANTFYISVGFFGLSAALLGPVLERKGPRPMLLFSSTMLFAGMLLAGLGCHVKNIGLVYFGYGVVGGIGFGASYITPVSPMQKWFPSKKGLLSGLAVCGFGGGSIASAQAQKELIKTVGLPLTFVILGAVYFCVMIPMAFVLRTPPSDYVEPETAAMLAKSDVTSKSDDTSDLMTSSSVNSKDENCVTPLTCDVTEAKEGDKSDKAVSVQTMPLQTVPVQTVPVPADTLNEPKLQYELLKALSAREYWLMYVVLIANSCAGLLTISKFSDICQKQFGKDSDFAADMVSINSAFNLVGRLVYGGLSDGVGQRPLFIVSLAYQSIVCFVVPAFLHSGNFWGYVVCIWVLSSFYGGGFGLMPAFLTHMFGSKNIGALHGVILTGWAAVGVIGGVTFSEVYKSEVSVYGERSPEVYDINFYWIGVIAFIGFICSLLIRTKLRDRLMPSISGQLMRLRLWKNVVRVQWVNKASDDREWEAYLRSHPLNHIKSSREYPLYG
eukprot:CFRG7476T1